MFKISPVQDKATESEYLKAVGLADNGSGFTYAMTELETGELMGISRFDILGGEGFIYGIKEVDGRDDFEAMFILARQTMNFIDSCGAHICRAPLECAAPDFMKSVGFKPCDDGYFCNMEGMFSGNCGCH